MIWSMSSQLSQTPRSCSSHALVLVLQSFSQRCYSFCLNYSHSHGLVKGWDIAKGNDSWQSFSFSLGYVVNKSNCTSRVADKFGKVNILLSDFSDAYSSILSYQIIVIFQPIKDFGENIVVHNYLSKICVVSADIGEARTNLSFELSILVVD